MTDEITLDAPETPLERFLAAAGMDGITLDDPVTRIERYLYKIAQGGGGSGGGVLVVTDTDGTLDKTWQEIHDAFVAGSVRIQNGTDTNMLVNVHGVEYHSKSGEYHVEAASAGGWTPGIYVASSADGYPTNV